MLASPRDERRMETSVGSGQSLTIETFARNPSQCDHASMSLAGRSTTAVHDVDVPGDQRVPAAARQAAPPRRDHLLHLPGVRAKS